MLIVCVCLGFILIKKMCQFRLQLHNLQVNTCTKDSLEDKGNLRFLEFDVEQLYPTITKPLMLKARLHTPISSEKEMILFHARKNPLIDCEDNIGKKIHNPEFDVSMGSMDGAQIAELIGIYVIRSPSLASTEMMVSWW